MRGGAKDIASNGRAASGHHPQEVRASPQPHPHADLSIKDGLTLRPLSLSGFRADMVANVWAARMLEVLLR